MLIQVIGGLILAYILGIVFEASFIWAIGSGLAIIIPLCLKLEKIHKELILIREYNVHLINEQAKEKVKSS